MLAALLALLLCLGLGWWLFTGSAWQIREVRLLGTDDPTVQAAVEALDVRGQNIVRCNLANAERRIAALPLVATVQAYKVYPDSAIFKVTLRQPVLRWHTKSQTLVLAADGTVLGPPDAAHASEWGKLPLLNDPPGTLSGGKPLRTGQRLPQENIEMAMQLLKAVSGSARATLTYASGLGFTATTADGQQIVFGTAADAIAVSHTVPSRPSASGDDVERGVTLELEEFKQLQALLARQEISATLIDLRWAPYPYYRTD